MNTTIEHEIVLAKARAYGAGMNDERASIINFLQDYSERGGTIAHAVAILGKDEDGVCATCGYDCPE